MTSGLHRGGRDGDAREQSDCIDLEVARFPHGFDLMLGVKGRGVKADFEVLAQATGRVRLPLAKMGKARDADWGGDGGGWGWSGSQEFDLNMHVKFEMSCSDTSSNVWGIFLHHQAILRHQLGVLQFNSILILSTQRQPSDSTDQGLTATRHPQPPLQIPISSSGCHPCF